MKHSDNLEVNNLYTVFKLYIVEVLKELVEEISGESPLRLLPPNESSEQCIRNRTASEGFFPPTYNRTVASRKFSLNFFKKAYNWLTEMNLLPTELRELSQFQVKKLISKTSSIFVVINRELFSMFYSQVYSVTVQGSFHFPSKVLSIVFFSWPGAS